MALSLRLGWSLTGSTGLLPGHDGQAVFLLFAAKQKRKSKSGAQGGQQLKSGGATVAPPAPHTTVDYSKFNFIVSSSDDEASAPYPEEDSGSCWCQNPGCRHFVESMAMSSNSRTPPFIGEEPYSRRVFDSEDDEADVEEGERWEPPQTASKSSSPQPTKAPPIAIKKGFFGSKPTSKKFEVTPTVQPNPNPTGTVGKLLHCHVTILHQKHIAWLKPKQCVRCASSMQQELRSNESVLGRDLQATDTSKLS